ncbi:MAG: hypothetical protein ACJATT_002304 [Myxococcota bacterium]|jgi:hypothetical protein
MIALMALLASQAFADDVLVTSRVESVTVFQGRARVTRVATARVPAGRSDIVFDALPLSLDNNSMTAEGEGRATLLGVDMRSVRGTEDRDERVRSLRADKQEREDQMAALADIVARVQADMAFRKAIVPTAPSVLREDLFLANDAPAQLAQLSSDVQDELRTLLREQRIAERQIRGLAVEVAALGRDIRRIGSETRDSKRAAVGIDASASGTVTVHLSYLVSNATWTPRYDARFDPQSNRVRLDVSGVVTQSTGEDWMDAALTVSTGAATRGTQPPTLTPFILGQSSGASVSRSPASLALVSEFDAPRAVDVPSDGSARQVRLASLDLDAKTVHRTVPRREPVAYLTARVTNTADWGLMPGPVNSYLGSAFVGRGTLSATPPSGKVDVSFGVDDRVAVERVRVEDLTLSQRALSSRDRQQWGFETRVTNRTGAPIELTVVEQVPASREDRFEVEVATRPDVSVPTEGVFQWESTLANGASEEFVLEYEISWPEGERPQVLD